MNLHRLLPLIFVGQSLAQIPEIISRPATENRFSPTGSDASGESIQGGIFLDHNYPNVPKNSGIHLTESSFGHAFSNYITPYTDYATSELLSIWSALYPPGYGLPGGVTATRSAIDNGGKPFRYKYLLYGTDGDSIAILDLFEASNNPAQWFGEDERNAVIAQIPKLRAAIAQDPLNTDLQNALLEIYYDWAVGESQLSKALLSKLARIRLGLETSAESPFIIDLEISTYEQLVENTQRILDVYKELLSLRIDGINPSDFDPAAGNAPFGYYLFQTRVPQRNQVASQYAPDDDSEIVDVLPSDPGQFTGYKDYRTLLTFLGQYIEYQAELARFRGIRKASGDLTKARNALTDVQNEAGLATLLGGMFTEPDGSPVDFDDPALDETGVRGAKFYVESSLADAADSRSYLNGESNHLGIDPHFLLLLPSGSPQVTPMQGPLATGLFDSYDIFQERLTQRINTNPVGPVAIAQDAFIGAKDAFDVFRTNVESVGDQLSGISTDFNDDFERLTGYGPNTQDQFTGATPNPIGTSELKAANIRISDLSRRNLDILAINAQILDEIALAQEAVTLAKGIEGKITGAESEYLTDAGAAWTEIHVWAGVAAGAAGAYQTLADVAGADISSKPLLGAVIAAGVLNTAVQTTAAIRTSMREQEIEEAAIAFEVALAIAPLELEVKQAQMVVSSLYRDLLSNLLEINDNNAALAQAIAERTAILREVQILKRNIESDFASLATSYFADPIFFIRAEREVLRADAAFRNAQRWMFYTCRALEYKWQQRFVWANGGNTFDINSILSARNYDELEVIRQHMASVDGQRRLGAGASLPSTTVISLRDQFITPNPDDPNLTFGASLTDTGERYSAAQERMVSNVDHFREILKRDHIQDGNIVINFNTSILQNFDGNFFLGPNFSGIPQSGNYRNKIVWTAVHMLKDGSEGEVTLEPAGLSGLVVYGGQTYFRTRVPVDPATRQASSNDFDIELDFPGAYVTAPVRYFQDTNLNGEYTMYDTLEAGHGIAESSTSALELTSPTRAAIINPANGFTNGLLKERAVAATRLTLQINLDPPSEANARNLIDQLDDIEILIQHQSYTRARIDE